MMFSLARNCSGSSVARRRVRLAALVLLISGACVIMGIRPAAAQDQAAIGRLVQMNKRAMDDYDTADFDTAKKALLEAEKTGKRAGLESHPIMARTYIHLGALYLVGYKDKQKAQHYFGKALDIQPDINLDKTLTSASVKDAFAAAKAQKGGGASGAGDAEDLFPPSGGKGAAKGPAKNTGDAGPDLSVPETSVRRTGGGETDVEPELPASIAALDCPYPDDTPPGKKVTLRCVAAANLNVAGVALFYKGFGMKDYERVEMSRSSKGWWHATVPRKRVDGKSLQFYFEGMDASEKPVVSNGRAESPNVMLIVEKGAAAPTAGRTGSEEEENPLEERSRSPRLVLGKRDESTEGLDTRFGNRRFWIGLGLGTGFALAIDGVPESRVCGIGNGPIGSSNPGTCTGGASPLSNSLAPITGGGWSRLGHLVPEIGFHINPNWAISIEGRNQWIPQSKKVANFTASGAHSVLLKVIHYSKQNQLRWFYGVLGGGGEGVRMDIQTDDQNLDLHDTIRIGGVLLGATGGMTYEFSRSFTWTAGLNGFYGFPKKGLAMDVSTGLQMNFGDTSGAADAAAEKKANSVSTSVDDEEPK